MKIILQFNAAVCVCVFISIAAKMYVLDKGVWEQKKHSVKVNFLSLDISLSPFPLSLSLLLLTFFLFCHGALIYILIEENWYISKKHDFFFFFINNFLLAGGIVGKAHNNIKWRKNFLNKKAINVKRGFSIFFIFYNHRRSQEVSKGSEINGKFMIEADFL